MKKVAIVSFEYETHRLAERGVVEQIVVSAPAKVTGIVQFHKLDLTASFETELNEDEQASLNALKSRIEDRILREAAIEES